MESMHVYIHMHTYVHHGEEGRNGGSVLQERRGWPVGVSRTGVSQCSFSSDNASFERCVRAAVQRHSRLLRGD